jgi:protein CWC15
MTTAHRPTWTAAREHGNEFGVYSSGGVRSAMAHARDVPNQLKMKYRTGHQLAGIADATPEDYAARLDAAERSSAAPQGQLLLAADARVAKAPDQLRDVAVAPGALDAYDDRDASDGGGSDSDSDSDDDDDGAALRAELEKIRAERDAERRREEDEAAAAKAAAATNPLLDPARSGEHIKFHGAFTSEYVRRGSTAARSVRESTPDLLVDSHAGTVRRRQEALERRRRLPPPGARRAGEGQDLCQRHHPQRLPQALPREVHPIVGACGFSRGPVPRVAIGKLK